MNRNTWIKLVAAAMIACAASAYSAETAPAAVKGNPNSKVYHKAACRYYKSKSSSKEFKSEADAKKAGYKACKQCAAPKTAKKTQASGNS